MMILSSQQLTKTLNILAWLGLSALAGVALSACGDGRGAYTANPADTERLVLVLDQQLLPNDQWQLSSERIQISFCRDRTNENLLAEAAELRLWRLTESVTAFPPYRRDGLLVLQQLYEEHDILLWQENGTVSAQYYRAVAPATADAPQVFSIIAQLNGLREVCLVGVDSLR